MSIIPTTSASTGRPFWLPGRNWDGQTTQDSRGAALAVIAGTRALGYEYMKPERDPMEALSETADDLMTALDALEEYMAEESDAPADLDDFATLDSRCLKEHRRPARSNRFRSD